MKLSLRSVLAVWEGLAAVCKMIQVKQDFIISHRMSMRCNQLGSCRQRALWSLCHGVFILPTLAPQLWRRGVMKVSSTLKLCLQLPAVKHKRSIITDSWLTKCNMFQEVNCRGATPRKRRGRLLLVKMARFHLPMFRKVLHKSFNRCTLLMTQFRGGAPQSLVKLCDPDGYPVLCNQQACDKSYLWVNASTSLNPFMQRQNVTLAPLVSHNGWYGLSMMKPPQDPEQCCETGQQSTSGERALHDHSSSSLVCNRVVHGRSKL